MRSRLTVTRRTIRGYVLSIVLVVFSFLLMAPLESAFKTAAAVIVGLFLTWPAYRLSRVMHSPYILVMIACFLSLIVSIGDGRFEQQHLLVFGVTALIPLAILAHRNAVTILAVATGGCALLFIPDLLFNLSLKLNWIARDVEITMRSGELVERFGGLFRHSFVSGIISLFAFTFLLSKLPRRGVLAGAVMIVGAALAILNADLAGSRRHILLIAITAGIFINARMGWPRLGFAAGLALVLAVFGYEIIFIGTDEGNQLRAMIWTRSFLSIFDHPWFGIGFNMPGTMVDTFDFEDKFLTESFFLSVGVWAGVPAMLFFIIAMIWPVIKSPLVRIIRPKAFSLQLWSAHFALYCALVLELLFGGILPSLFGALIIGALLGVLEPTRVQNHVNAMAERGFVSYRSDFHSA